MRNRDSILLRNHIVAFVAGFEAECGCGPSRDWIALAIGRSDTAISHHLRTLIDDGSITVTRVPDHESGSGAVWLYNVIEKAPTIGVVK